MGAIQARAALVRMAPSALVGFGGYPVVAPVLATRLMRDPPPVVLHDQNAVLGTANRAMARFATAVALSFERVARVPAGVRTVVTGNPVRHAFAARAAMDDRVRLLVLGGSLGARVFSDIVPPALALLPDMLRERLMVTQQCRPEDIQRVGQAYAMLGVKAELSPFFTDIPTRLARPRCSSAGPAARPWRNSPRPARPPSSCRCRSR